MYTFESKVLSGLQKCGLDLKNNKSHVIGAAVSGGADSVALLISLVNILKDYNIPLKVISVNHNIRSSEESGGDAAYVEGICTSLRKDGYDVTCKIVELEPGLVSKTAVNRGQGIEDSARYLRYLEFEIFIKEFKTDYLCLAHNQNDQMETLIMRFLQGAGCESEGGIAYVRGKYIRPMLEIERSEIEQYLIEREISWRTDNTNFDTNYLRNKIRHKLVPVLDSEFPGWKKALLSGSKKADSENEVLENMVDYIEYSESDNCLSINKDSFNTLPEIIKVRLLIKLINQLGITKRIPYGFLQDLIVSISNPHAELFTKSFDEIEIEVKKDLLLVKKYVKNQTDLVFFDIIEESGKYLFPFGEIDVFLDGDNCADIIRNDSVLIKSLPVPFCVRNIQLDDHVEASDGILKNIADIMSDWHVSEEHRLKIPVFQELESSNQSIKAVLGSIFGYKDWIVK